MAIRGKMQRQDRAKQFMPFAALKGYEEALLEKEKVVVSKKVLSDYSKEQLDLKIHSIRKNDIITVIYYQDDNYLKITGMLSKLDWDARYLTVVRTRISFDDIYDIILEKSTK